MGQMERLQINSRKLGNFFNLGGLVEIGRDISQIVRTRFYFILETPRLNKILELYVKSKNYLNKLGSKKKYLISYWKIASKQSS